MLNLAMLVLPLLQGTHVVDAAGGPGSNFTDIPPAVAVAASGDTILVRAGTYTGFATDKALSVIGAGASVTTIIGTGPAIEIHSPPLGETFLLAGFECRSGVFAVFGGVTLWSGNLTILDCELHGSTGIGIAALSAFGSTVHASRCSFEGSPGATSSHFSDTGGAGAWLNGSSLSAEFCTFQGGPGLAIGPFGLTTDAGDGLMIVNGHTALSRCDVFGAQSPNMTGGHGIHCTGGNVQMSGITNNVCQGGSASTLLADGGGSITVHGSIAVLPPSGGGTTTAGVVVLGQPALPFLEVLGTALPNGALHAALPATVTYDGLVSNAPFFFMIGFRPDYDLPIATGQIGALLVDLQTAGLIFGTLDGAGQFSFSVPTMVLAPVFGLPIHAQAGTFDAGLGLLRTSNGNIERFSL